MTSNFIISLFAALRHKGTIMSEKIIDNIAFARSVDVSNLSIKIARFIKKWRNNIQFRNNFTIEIQI